MVDRSQTRPSTLPTFYISSFEVWRVWFASQLFTDVRVNWKPIKEFIQEAATHFWSLDYFSADGFE